MRKITTEWSGASSKNTMWAGTRIFGGFRAPLWVLPAAAAMLWSSARASERTGIRFSGQGFRVGDSITVESRSLADQKFTIFSKGKAILKEHNIDLGRERRVESILSQEAGIARSIKVFIELDQEMKRSNSKSRKVKRVTHGRTYIISRVKDKLEIRYPDGKEPGQAERRILARRFSDLGRMSMGSALLLGRRLKVGARADYLVPVIKKYFGEKKNTRYEGTKITFAGTRNKDGAQCALFRFSTTAHLPAGSSTSIIVSLDGEMLYRVRGAWPVSFVMRGPISIESKDKRTGMRGEGRAELIYNFTYKKKPKAKPRRRTIGG